MLPAGGRNFGREMKFHPARDVIARVGMEIEIRLTRAAREVQKRACLPRTDSPLAPRDRSHYRVHSSVLPPIFDTIPELGATKLHATSPYPFLHLAGRFETLAVVVTFS
jgi:hypothetical protein